MQKKLRQAGSSYTLTLTKTMLEILKINPKQDMVELNFEGDKLIINKGLPIALAED